MTTETSLAEMVENVAILKQPKEWGVELSEITLTRPDGSDVGLTTSSYLRTDNNLHFNQDQGGITYDIPADGDFNFILYSNENNELIPLAAASIGIENETPTVTMIQKVKSREKRDIPPLNPNNLIKINAIYDRVPHPKQDLLQGNNKIEWQKVLLDQCIAKTKSQGYSKLRIRSGFASKYEGVGHNLPLSVQQYDYLVNNDKNWTPIDLQGKQITDSEQRSDLSHAIRRIRDKKIKTMDDLGLQYPNLPIPKYWEKII
jgi:hypothetical protein